MNAPPVLVRWLGVGGVVAAVAFTTMYEGTRYTTYRDSGGVLTACVGETAYIATPGDIKPGAKFTKAQCDAALIRSFGAHADGLLKCAGDAAYDWSPGQRVAILDFTFNVGVAAACNSTLIRLAKAGDMNGACQEFSRWYRVGQMDCRKPANANKCGGIPKRRVAEYQLCLESENAG